MTKQATTSNIKIFSKNLAPGAIFQLPLTLLFIISIVYAGGSTYTLDDPYIHLAIAKQIFNGHYGIQAGEFSAASSSIVWPFLLAPFAGLTIFEYTPFIINAICVCVTSALVWQLIDRSTSPHVRIVVALISPRTGGAMKDESGQIRTSIQGQGCSTHVAA